MMVRRAVVFSTLIILAITLVASVLAYIYIKEYFTHSSKHVEISPLLKKIKALREYLQKVTIVTKEDIALLLELKEQLEKAYIPSTIVYTDDLKRIPPDSKVYIVPSSFESNYSLKSIAFPVSLTPQLSQFFVLLSEPSQYAVAGCTFHRGTNEMQIICSNKQEHSSYISVLIPLQLYNVPFIVVPIKGAKGVSYYVEVANNGKEYTQKGIVKEDYIVVPTRPSVGRYSIIADFEDSLDGFMLGCGGNTRHKFVTGVHGKALRIYPTGGNWLGCARKPIGTVHKGQTFYFLARGKNIWAQVWCNYPNSKLYVWRGTWQEVQYHSSEEWSLYKLVVQNDASNCAIYIYAHGTGSWGEYDFILNGNNVLILGLEVPPGKTVSYTVGRVYGAPSVLCTHMVVDIDTSAIKLYTSKEYSSFVVVPNSDMPEKHTCVQSSKRYIGTTLSSGESITIEYSIPQAYTLSSLYHVYLVLRGVASGASVNIYVNNRRISTRWYNGDVLDVIDITENIGPSTQVKIEVQRGNLYIDSVLLYFKGEDEDYFCVPDLQSKSKYIPTITIQRVGYQGKRGKVLVIAPSKDPKVQAIIQELESSGYIVYFKETSKVHSIGFFDYYLVLGSLPYSTFADDVLKAGKTVVQVINSPTDNKYFKTGAPINMGSITIYDYDNAKTLSIVLTKSIYRIVPKQMYPVWITMYGYIIGACTPSSKGKYCVLSLPIDDTENILKFFFKVTGIPSKLEVHYDRYLKYRIGQHQVLLKEIIVDGSTTISVHTPQGPGVLILVGSSSMGVQSIEISASYNTGETFSIVVPGGNFIVHIPVPSGMYITSLSLSVHGIFAQALRKVKISNVLYVDIDNFYPSIEPVQDLLISSPSPEFPTVNVLEQDIVVNGERSDAHSMRKTTYYGYITTGLTLSTSNYESYQYYHTKYAALFICEGVSTRGEYTYCRTLSPKKMRVDQYEIIFRDKNTITPFYITGGSIRSSTGSITPDYNFPYVYDKVGSTGYLKYGMGKETMYPRQYYSGNTYHTFFSKYLSSDEKTLELFRVPLTASTFNPSKVLYPIYIVHTSTRDIQMYSIPGYYDLSPLLESLKNQGKIIIVLTTGSTKLPVETTRVVLESPVLVSDIFDMYLQYQGTIVSIIPPESTPIVYDKDRHIPVVSSFYYNGNCIVIVPWNLVESNPEVLYNILGHINKIC